MENYIDGNYRELIIKLVVQKSENDPAFLAFSQSHLVKSTLHSCITVAMYTFQSFL